MGTWLPLHYQGQQSWLGALCPPGAVASPRYLGPLPRLQVTEACGLSRSPILYTLSWGPDSAPLQVAL